MMMAADGNKRACLARLGREEAKARSGRQVDRKDRQEIKDIEVHYRHS